MKRSTTNRSLFLNIRKRKESDFLPIEDVKADFSSSPSTIATQKNFSVRNNFSANDVETSFLRGQKIKRSSVSGSVYSVSASEYLLSVTSLALAPSIGLPRPSLVGPGKTYRVKDEVGGAASTTITVLSQGEETIDGASTSTITTNYGFKGFYTDGSVWFTY